jgi:hypothetical protein
LAAAATALVAECGFVYRRSAAIYIDREPDNRASGRVAERLGGVVSGSRSVQYRGADVELVRHTLLAPTASRTEHR